MISLNFELKMSILCSDSSRALYLNAETAQTKNKLCADILNH